MLKKNGLLKIMLIIVFLLNTFSVPAAEAVSHSSYKLNPKKVYTYTSYDPEGFKLTYTAKYLKKYKKGDLWLIYHGYELWKEDKSGLRIGNKDTDSDAILWYTYLPYPIKKGKKWKDVDGLTNKITSTSRTIKTKAGTFKNCIAVDVDGSATFYYAKGVGLIYSKTKSGYIQELVKLKNK